MAFSYYSPETVNGSQVPSTQTDFPRLINVTDARFKTTGNGGHVQNSSGFDIRPYSDSGLTSALTYELERYNASSGEVIMWVKIPSISNGNVVYLGYGDAGLNSDGSSTATWSNNFLGVYHLKDGSSLDVNSATGSNNGTNNSATATTGKIDGAAAFVSASSQYIDLGTGMAPTKITLSAWVNATSFPNSYNSTIVRWATASASFAYLQVKSTGKLSAGVAAEILNPTYDGSGTFTLSTDTWYYLVLTYGFDTGEDFRTYVNASQDNSLTQRGALKTNSATTDIAKDPINSGRFWDGKIDEARVASVFRSANWVTTEYNNQSAPQTFATLGTEVAVGGATRRLFFVGGQ